MLRSALVGLRRGLESSSRFSSLGMRKMGFASQPFLAQYRANSHSLYPIFRSSASCLPLENSWGRNTALSRAFTTEDGSRVHELLTLASEGSVKELQEILNSGVNVNLIDYDKRSALHLATSEGHLRAVKLLVERGANINAVDRFGGTPLHDALEARRSDIASYLRHHGANLGNRQEQLIQKVCNAAAAGNVSVLESIYDNSFLTVAESADYDRRTPLHLAAADGHAEAADYLLQKGADPRAKDRFGNTPIDEAKREGHEAIVAMLSKAKPVHAGEDEHLREIETTIEQLREHYNGVKSYLLQHKLYSEKLILSELDWYYYNLGLPSYYFNRFPPNQAYKHIEAYIAAKQVAFANGTPEDIRIDGVETSDGSTFFLCPSDSASIYRVEEQIDNLAQKSKKENQGTCFSVYYMTSTGPAIPHGREHLSLFVVDRNSFDDIDSISSSETDFRKIAGPSFSYWRRPLVINQFEELMAEATERISPTFRILPQHEGLAHVMLAHRRNSYTTPIRTITRILESCGIPIVRKIIEQFANGITIHSLYFQPRAEDLIRKVLNDISLMLIARKSTDLLPLYLSGELTANEYAYCGAVTMFVYYFMAHQDDSLEFLFAALKGDQEKIGHLENIRQSLKRETVSLTRISHTMRAYPQLVKALVSNFESKFGYQDFSEEDWNKELSDIKEKIVKIVDTDQDREIFEQVALFNEVIVKTNFYKVPKTALSFRIDPSFLARDKTYPEAPFGVFLMVGSEFHGFHVRFQDVARGGIRLVRSPDKISFSRNLETAFFENYNLAHTQNRKNKDIPEFGSKGVLLMYPSRGTEPHEESEKQAFHKYMSSFLDLICPGFEQVIKDYYGKPELIFCGPDENTANLMEWAALYARKKGYPYWKAFTTGKPQSMGGIPHDLYGMTTNSVHQFVVEALNDHNLQEEEVTKFQTGGPDGDLGSNEVLISKDKTTAIVDGSGVLFDPNGLHREELVRLAENRQTIDHFDDKYLDTDQGAFRVLVSQNDVPLPDGTVVPSGLKFRNEFHLTPYSSADLFVPCGGRPESVSGKNVNLMFHEDGTPRFKFIVEGANLFFTQEARTVLESRGVVLFKDASTNKGGVTSSSLEVLAALAMTEEEHSSNMCVMPGQPIPEFYKKYVEEVQERVRSNARMEYRCLTKEHGRTGRHRHLLTDALSDKINSLTDSISKSQLYSSPSLRNKVMGEAIPIQLQELIPGGLETILKRLPETYVKTCFCTHLASRFVYSYGLDAGEFAFFEYMDKMASEPVMSDD